MKDLSIGGIILLDNTSGEAEEIVAPLPTLSTINVVFA